MTYNPWGDGDCSAARKRDQAAAAGDYRCAMVGAGCTAGCPVVRGCIVLGICALHWLHERGEWLIADAAAATAKLLASIQQNALQTASQDKGWDELLARLAENQKKSRGGDKQESEVARFT